MHTQDHSALLTDFYQLTMAYGYWKLGMHEQRAAFNLLFRKTPFRGNYAVCCGLGSIVEFLSNWRFAADDIAYLATIPGGNDQPLFPQEFLDYLAGLQFNGDVHAIPEGTIVFPHTPLLRIEGPLIQCQLIESALLNTINFQSLIATKASRVCRAAGKDQVIEFGLRRAQGPNGAISASRAAYIGGCTATSNTLAGKLFGIPVRGTHAHSWVTAFPNEQEAFTAYATIMPHACVLLVDTYNTIEGVKNAIAVGKKLRENGADLLGIRLDSGDLASLSIQARAMLDEAGFANTDILASNSLDEYVITSLKQQGATISAWGVGTNLTTAYDQPALDGVYKLSALQTAQGEWQYKLKLSEQDVKTSNPGRHQVRRFFTNEQYFVDVIYDLELGISDTPEAILIDQAGHPIDLNDYDAYVDLLQLVMQNGTLVAPLPSIHDSRTAAIAECQLFQQTHQENTYPVGLEKKLYAVKQALVKKFNPAYKT